MSTGRWRRNKFKFNPSFAITVRIKQVEVIEIAREKEKCLLLIVAADTEDSGLLLGLAVGGEPLKTTVAGAA